MEPLSYFLGGFFGLCILFAVVDHLHSRWARRQSEREVRAMPGHRPPRPMPPTVARGVLVTAAVPRPLPNPKYIYHRSSMYGEDDLFEFSTSGAVDIRDDGSHCPECERLYTEEQVRELLRTSDRGVP